MKETETPTPQTQCCHACETNKPETDFVADGIDGYRLIWVCLACLESFTPFQRTILHILASQSFEGGLCPSAQLEAIERRLPREYRGSTAAAAGRTDARAGGWGGENPYGFCS